MTYLPPLAELDRDGAIQETAEQVEDGETRSSFLRKAGVGLGAVMAGASLPGVARAATAALSMSDVAILNFALTLEYLEAEFYAQAKASGALTGETARFAEVVANHEAAHVRFLRQTLGRKAVAKPRFDFKGTTADQAQFEATADVLEATGVHAYLGQAANIKAKAVLVGAGRILAVEARHAAWIRDIRFSGGTTAPTTPAPASFEDGFSKARILRIVQDTGFIVT